MKYLILKNERRKGMEDFKKKYNVFGMVKNCLSCKHSFGTWCRHPELEEDFIIGEECTCDAWECKPKAKEETK
jgi:hypothetical protein